MSGGKHDWTDIPGKRLGDFDWLQAPDADAQRREALQAPIDYAAPERQAWVRDESRWWRRLRARVEAWLLHVPGW